MATLQIITTCVCGVATWLFIVPSRLWPNKRYRRLFWIFYPILFFATSLSANALDIHTKWYAPGLAVIICAIVASQISIHIAPNKYPRSMNIEELKLHMEEIKNNVDHGSHYGKPAHALMLSMCWRDTDYELSVKYASLTVEMLDSLDPSDLIGPYREFIADGREFARDVYLNIVNGKYESDEAYQNSLRLYRAEQSDEENLRSEAAAIERMKIISYFYK